MKQTLKRTVFVLTFSAACLLPMAVHAAGEMSEPVQSVQQTRAIKGHVVDENGEPMIGVTIYAGKTPMQEPSPTLTVTSPSL